MAHHRHNICSRKAARETLKPQGQHNLLIELIGYINHDPVSKQCSNVPSFIMEWQVNRDPASKQFSIIYNGVVSSVGQ